MTSVELAKIRRENNSKASLYRKNKSAVSTYNGVSSLYDGEGRGMTCALGCKKRVGHMTNLAESMI